MEDLIQLVSEKTGLPEEQSKAAVETVINYLKEQLPEPLGSQIDSLLEGGGIGDIVGNLFG